MFRTDLLSIIRSLNTVYKATGTCNKSYVDCLLARSGRNSVYFVIPYCSVSLIQFFFGVLILMYLFCWLGIDEFDIQRAVHRDIFFHLDPASRQYDKHLLL